jgi:hypothetical protein
MIHQSSLNVSKVRQSIPCEPYMRGCLVQSSDSFYLTPYLWTEASIFKNQIGSISQNTTKFISTVKRNITSRPFFVTTQSVVLEYPLNDLQVLAYHIRHSF